jgi:hypothetical protein
LSVTLLTETPNCTKVWSSMITEITSIDIGLENLV